MAPRDERLGRRLVSFAKNSPWLMIAIGLHVIVAATMSVVYIHHELQKKNDAVLSMAVAKHAPKVEAPLLSEPEPDRQKIPESEAPAELVPHEDVQTFVPTEDPPENVDWHDEIGDPTGTDDDNSSSGGTSAGVGQFGHYGNGTPSSLLGKRLGKGNGLRGGRRVETASVGTELAVLEGLRWLMRHQEENGSWSPATLHTHCTEPPCIPADATLDSSFDTGMTALALLAFLGQGIAPGSKQLEIVDTAMGRPPRAAGEIVKRGIRWLLDRQKADGSFSSSAPFALPENDTLSTMALCEAYALAPTNRLIKQQAQRALDFLVAAQKRGADGSPAGWGIGSQSDLDARHERGELDDEAYAEQSASVDLSITCWVVMALKSAQSCGFRVPDAALAGALAYAEASSAETSSRADTAGAVHVDPNERFDFHAARRSALGMLVRTFAGGRIDDPFLERAAREIAADVPQVSKDGLSVETTTHAFASRAIGARTLSVSATIAMPRLAAYAA